MDAPIITRIALYGFIAILWILLLTNRARRPGNWSNPRPRNRRSIALKKYSARNNNGHHIHNEP